MVNGVILFNILWFVSLKSTWLHIKENGGFFAKFLYVVLRLFPSPIFRQPSKGDVAVKRLKVELLAFWVLNCDLSSYLIRCLPWFGYDCGIKGHETKDHFWLNSNTLPLNWCSRRHLLPRVCSFFPTVWLIFLVLFFWEFASFLPAPPPPLPYIAVKFCTPQNLSFREL